MMNLIYIYIYDYYLTRPKILQNLEIKDSVGLGTSPGGEAQAPLAGSLAHAVHSPMALNASCTLGNALPGSAASQIDTGQIEMDASLGHCHCHCWPNQVKSALYILYIYIHIPGHKSSPYIYIFNIYIYYIINTSQLMGWSIYFITFELSSILAPAIIFHAFFKYNYATC